MAGWADYNTPGEWFGAGYAAGTNSITFNTNDAASNKTLTELTDAEAAASTGDVRKVIFAICEQLFYKYNSIAVADRPTKLSITKSASLNSATKEIANTYTIRITTSVVTQEVADEPA